jgi:LPS O-antigen subunit length determinant protein (WzzB/FepE family)
LIVAVTLISALISVAVALHLPNKYTSEAILSPRGGGAGGALGQLAAQYGSVASLAGISLSGAKGTDSAKTAQEMLTTRKFFGLYLYEAILPELIAATSWDSSTDKVLYDENIFNPATKSWVKEDAAKLQARPSVQEAHSRFVNNFLAVEEDKRSGFLRVSITHFSPSVARNWVELIVKSINEAVRSQDVQEAENAIKYLEEQSSRTSLLSLTEVFATLIEEQTKTVMLAHASNEYVFKIIEPPVAPERKSEPRRAVICIMGVLLGALLSVLMVLVQHYTRSGLRIS